MNIELVNQRLSQHIINFWPQNHKDTFTWTLGNIKESIPGFSVVRVSPQSADEPWVYLTRGVSTVETNGHERIEFFIIAPEEDPIHIETLAMISNFHADPRYTLSLGDSVSIGREWIEGASCEYLLVSLPYPYGPELERCSLDNGGDIRYLWLLPITESENNFLKSSGLEALEALFDEHEIDALDAMRNSVV